MAGKEAGTPRRRKPPMATASVDETVHYHDEMPDAAPEDVASDDTDAPIIKKERKTRFVYRDEDDVKLLKEVLSDDGIFVEDTKEHEQWRGVSERLRRAGLDVTAHSMRRRLKTIYEAFQSSERTSKAASGVSEEHDEKMDLLTEYHDLLEERKAELADKKQHKVDADKRNDVGGRAIRDAALSSMERPKKEDKP